LARLATQKPEYPGKKSPKRDLLSRRQEGSAEIKEIQMEQSYFLARAMPLNPSGNRD
jgi:hypothetical protein